MARNDCHKVKLMGEQPDDKENLPQPAMDQPAMGQEIAQMREEMLRFATLQLRDVILAEDVVHEAIDAALSAGKYSAKGELKSWVFAILRNKIIDVIRERIRHPTEHLVEDSDALETQFDEQGHWRKTQRPVNWEHPEVAFANEQFWLIFTACLNQLPEKTAQVFMMREHLGLEINEICVELNLSDNNAWVIMHRARMQLRKCLEVNYIQGEQIS